MIDLTNKKFNQTTVLMHTSYNGDNMISFTSLGATIWIKNKISIYFQNCKFCKTLMSKEGTDLIKVTCGLPCTSLVKALASQTTEPYLSCIFMQKSFINCGHSIQIPFSVTALLFGTNEDKVIDHMITPMV